MKRLLFLLLASLLLVACSDDAVQETNQSDETINNTEEEINEVVSSLDESTDNLKAELYDVTLNEILNDYDETYELFDKDAATSLQVVVSEMYSLGVVHNMKDELIKDLTEEEKEVYGQFINEVIQLEELVNGSD